MIEKLRRKLVFIVMSVVAIILLAIFVTLLVTTQKNNERMSVGILGQVLNMRTLPESGAMPRSATGKPNHPQRPTPQMRLPVLLVEVTGEGEVSVLSNQLHFIEESEIEPLAQLAADKTASLGVLSSYALRYMREETATGMRIAFADTSVEQQILQTQILNSLIVGSVAMLSFFVLSLFLARWAVKPVEVAWEQQKQFIANASHELKTPLTVILSNADMLRAEKMDAENKNARRMEHIQAEALRMKQLVEDMLLLAQSDSKEKAEIHTKVDFSYLAKSAVLMYEPIVYDEEKTLKYDVEAALFVMGDSSRLQQVLHIFLDNAQKYSSAHGAIWVRVHKAENKTLLLEVSSDGVPIPKEDLQKVFLRFFRRDEARSAHGSFGLGLSIAQSIVHRHGGKIWAESDGETRNSFYISLPLA